MGTKHIRLKRYDPRHGFVLKQYGYKGMKFLESEGWYIVDDEVADYLEENARQRAGDPGAPAAFDVCTEAEARRIDEKEAIEEKPRRPAEKARSVAPRGKKAPKAKKTRKGSRKAKPKKDPPAKKTKNEKGTGEK